MVARMRDADAVTAVIFEPAVVQQLGQGAKRRVVVALINHQHTHSLIGASEHGGDWRAHRASKLFCRRRR